MRDPSNQKKKKQASIIKRAYRERSSIAGDGEAIDPVFYVENILNKKKKNFDYSYHDFVRKDGQIVEAKVIFGEDIEMQVSKSALMEASKCLPLSRFTFAHEIGHVLLHEKPMRARISGSSRPRSVDRSWISKGVPIDHPHLQLHRKDADMEREANVFAGAFLIPYTVVTYKSVPAELAKKYHTSIKAAEVFRSQVLQSWRYLYN